MIAAWQQAFAILAIGLLSLLASCASPSTPARPQTSAVTPTAKFQISTVTLQPTATPEPTRTAAATITPTATSIPEPSQPACPPSGRFQSDVTLPNLSALHWEGLTVEGQRARHMAGLDYPSSPLDLSPDGRWLIVAFEIEKTTGRAAMAVIDTQGEAHWWMNQRANFFSPYFDEYPYLYPGLYPRWLPDGRLLWVDEACKVFAWDGQNRGDLGAPEPMGHVVYASDGIALAVSVKDGDLWRVDLASGTWEEVTTPSRAGGFILAHDGSYALAGQWRIPTEMGAVAKPLPDIKGWVEPPGHGGPSGPPSTQLAGTSYWLLNNVGVFNERDGSIITARDLRLPEDYSILSYYASPDGRWLAVTLWRKDSPPPVRDDPNLELYITPVEDFKAGRVLKGVSVAGWHTDAPAVILKDNATGTLSTARLPLADTASGATLNGAIPPLAMLPGLIFAVNAGSPARLLQFDLDSNLLNALDLSAQYESIQAARGAQGRVFLGVKGRQDQSGNTCTYVLVEWTIGP